MKKIICILLAALSCGVFAASASAEGDMTQTTTTEPTAAVTTVPTSAAQGFTGAVKITHDTLPVNTGVPVTIAVEGGTLMEGDTIRYCLYKPGVSLSDADRQWLDYTGPVTVTDNTVIEAAVFFADGSRSASALSEITCIDKIAPDVPVMQASVTEWTKDPVLVTVTGGEDAQSGFLRLEYRLGTDGAWAEYSAPISIAAPTAVYARSVDAAGNTSEAAKLDVSNFDNEAPDVAAMSVKISAAGAPVVADSGAFSKYFGSDVTVTIDGAVDAASGMKSYQYQAVSDTGSAAEDKWQDYDPAKPPVLSGDFCGFVYARAVDAVGNTSAAVGSEGFVIDVTPPVIDNIKLSETAVTGSRVIVDFSVNDNFWLETVTVNGVYAGVYVSSFTAFRNDDYLIVAIDKVGNRTEQLVQITNINTTPFTLLDTWNGLEAQNFTPASWAAAEKAADELQTLITVEAPQNQVEAAAGRLLTALEGLVTRGDGTLSRELIDRIRKYDSELYTESSWARVEDGISALELCLNDPESTQEAVDNSRRALEQLLSELVKRADFTDLDRLIAQSENIDTGKFSSETRGVFEKALNEARELSRTDSGQPDADEAYAHLLAAMGGLEADEKGGFNFTPLLFVILGLLIVATASALFIVRARAKAAYSGIDDAENEDVVEDSDGISIGDIHFTDDEPSEEIIGGADSTTYIGSSVNTDVDSYIGGRRSGSNSSQQDQ